MQYVSFEARTFEEALEKARSQYGNRIRIHSKKDFYKKGFLGLGRIPACEITCFIIGEELKSKDDKKAKEKEKKDLEQFEAEAKTPSPDVEIEKVEQPALFSNDEPISEHLLDYTQSLLEANDFSSSYIQWMKSQISILLKKALPALPNEEDIQLSLVDKIALSIDIDHKGQSSLDKNCVFIGPSASGKTSCIAKLASLYSDKDVAIVTLDDQASSWDQTQKLAQALNVSALQSYDENTLEQALNTFKDKDIVLFDTKGQSVAIKEKESIFSVLSGKLNKAKFYAVIPASMKNSDICSFFDTYSDISFSGVIVTKEDESTTVGNIISLCHDRNLSLVYVSNGRKIPKDFKKASTYDFLNLLKGFSVDFSNYSNLKK